MYIKEISFKPINTNFNIFINISLSTIITLYINNILVIRPLKPKI